MPSTQFIFRVFALFACAATLSACSGGTEERAPTLNLSTNGGGNEEDPCDPPREGCGCEDADEEMECGTVVRHSADYITCSYGVMTCGEDGKWGTCIGDEISILPVPGTGANPQALGSPEPCTNNPCDPWCISTVDTGSGIIPPPNGFVSGPGGLTITPRPPIVKPSCTALTVTPATQTVTVTKLVGASGLYGEYFDKKTTASQIPSGWTPKATRIDKTINFNWGSAAPGPAGIGIDAFSVRWTGELLADQTTNFRLHMISDDGARVWLDGSLIIDRWVDQGPTEVISNQLSLVKGETYSLRVEYYENSGGATSQLYWSTASRARTIIPSENFIPPSVMAGGFTTNPSSVPFQAELQPPGCFKGATHPAWTLSRYDTSAVDSDGLFKVFSGISSDIRVDAYLGDFVGSANVKVRVNVLEDEVAPPGSVTAFQGATTGADPATFLYPYANTVFPLGLAAPTVQYDTGGTAASAVKLTLRYPAGGSPTFQWSTVVPESSPARVAVPLYAWKAFEQTAKGRSAEIVLQRLVSGSPRVAVVRPIVFAEAPVRGRIYYTQYGRNGSTKLMVVDPGSATPARDAYGNSDGCPVCHSVSAQGNLVATSNLSFSSQGGISEIGSDGGLTPLADHPNDKPEYKNGSQDWRGFAWAPLSPDGTLALVANNIWGNSQGGIKGINTTNDTISVPDALLSGANGTGLLAEYFSNNTWGGARWAKHVPFVNFDFDAAGPGGPIGTNFTARYSGQVMPYFSENYSFTVTSTGGVKLTVNGVVVINDLAYNGAARAVSGNIVMTRGVKANIVLDWRDTNADAVFNLSWSSPSTPFALVPVDQLWPSGGQRGVLASYYSANNFTSLFSTSVEPDVNANYGALSPFGLPANNFSTRWQGRLEAPLTGTIRLCVSAEDDVVVRFNGANVISQTGTVNVCSANLTVTEGTLYDLQVDHREFTNNASVVLSWDSATFTRTPISGAYLRLPTSFTVPTTGLTATYYDGPEYTTGLGINPGAIGAMTTYVSRINDAWSTNRPNYGALTNSDTFSVRYTGSIQLPCDGIYEFRNVSDDGSSVWIDHLRLNHRTTGGTANGAAHFKAGTYNFKYQMQDATGSAAAQLSWIPHCLGATALAAIPQANFLPTGTDLTAGFVRSGGDNTGTEGYWVWDLPPASGATPKDITADTKGRWGLGLSTMMVPSFSPAGDRLVFVDGDSGGGAGWRKGLSVFDFDQDEKLFTSRRLIVNNWPFGNVIKWPVFESDSRSVLYQASTPVDWCCKGGWTNYGHMSPTNYFETPGELWSVNTEAANPSPVELKVLNEGERAVDANKAYQPTMLPEAAGGYRWVVFTSTRPYGNTFNLPATQNDYSNPASYTPMVKSTTLQSMLWVAAVDDTASGATDRSHPAFLLPSQNYSETASAGFLNERGFWALEECRSTGTTSASLCEVDEDCCGSAVCRLDTPVTQPPVRHCQSKPMASTCTPVGDGCNDSSDCCFGDVCVAAKCEEAPALEELSPVNYTRTFDSECEGSDGAIWRFFDWQATTPGDSSIEFYAESAETLAEFTDLEVAPNPVSSTNAVGVGLVAGPTISGWVGNDVSAQLAAAGLPHRKYLRITMRFIPSSDSEYTPQLTTWRQSYDCFPDQ